MKVSLDENRRAFRASDLVVMLLLGAMFVCLVAPALAQFRFGNQRNACLNNMKQIAIALQNFHDTRKCFPMASTKTFTGKPGHAGDADAAGFSWIAMTLPFMEESVIYDRLAKASDKFQKDPFDPAVTTKEGGGNLVSRNQRVESFLCPSFLAERPADAPGQVGGEANAAKKGNGLSNYQALASSHLFQKEGIGRLIQSEFLKKDDNGRAVCTRAYEGNGVICFPGVVGGKISRIGLGMQSISDGTSRTAVVAETIEPEFASWLDGQVTWLVGAWPSNPDIPQPDVSKNPGTIGPSWTKEQLPKNWLALNQPNAKDKAQPPGPYLPAARWVGGKDRKFGPSSYHGNVVPHAFGDAHVDSIKDDIDKNVYLHLITRNGREIDQDLP
jgi:hypothetical protein